MNMLTMTDVEFFTLINMAAVKSAENSPMRSINSSVITSVGNENSTYDYQDVINGLYEAGFLVELAIKDSKNINLVPKKEILTLLEWISKPTETISFRRASLISEPAIHFVGYKNTYLRLSILGNGTVFISLPYQKEDIKSFFQSELVADYKFSKNDIKQVEYKLSRFEMIAINGLILYHKVHEQKKGITSNELLALLALQIESGKLPKIINNAIVLKDLCKVNLEAALSELINKNIVIKEDNRYQINEAILNIFSPTSIIDVISIIKDNRADKTSILQIMTSGVNALHSFLDDNGEAFISYNYSPFEGEAEKMFHNAVNNIL